MFVSFDQETNATVASIITDFTPQDCDAFYVAEVAKSFRRLQLQEFTTNQLISPTTPSEDPSRSVSAPICCSMRTNKLHSGLFFSVSKATCP